MHFQIPSRTAFFEWEGHKICIVTIIPKCLCHWRGLHSGAWKCVCNLHCKNGGVAMTTEVV